MIVIFGIQGGRLRRKRHVVRAWCSECEEPTDLEYAITRRYASLFLVPVLPLRRRHWLACFECRKGHRLTHEQVGVAAAMADLTENAQKGQIAMDDYDRIADTYITSGFTSVHPVPLDIEKTCGWCATPIAPESSRCPACDELSPPWSEACGLWLVSDGEGRTFASSQSGGWDRVRPGQNCPECGESMALTSRSCERCGAASRTRPALV